ncbi:helix-turn-helix domain-containing protein [Paenibacillus xylanexedens]|uniref:Transcriptional regulator n=1 Tax=Paenibacillus xylanexedens TaxID=528191 RepID=A0ABS4RVE7_PAEXY|nr:helix-turn-helix transcriptional regulator [Paenibacillus xylanexedens]KAA2301064.1 helix-turn-helix transcriptional regulator [Clostridioides difficile]MBP2246416.1 putative transcriptional regulator [Paenibacillus xylanexedens]
MIKFTLDEVLKDKGMTMYALAKKSGVRPNTIGQWVTGNGAEVKSITIDTLERICLALECKPGDIIKMIDEN